MGEKIKCIRCGVCCLNNLCRHGETDPVQEGCRFLIKKNGAFACYLMLKKIIKPSEIRITRGCTFRKFPEMYRRIKERIEYEKLIKTINFKKRFEGLEKE